jgi:hypothetical protein
MKRLFIIAVSLVSSCIGIVHQEDLIPTYNTVNIPHGYIDVQPWPFGAQLRYKAPWGLSFKPHFQRNKYETITIRLISIMSDIQNLQLSTSTELIFELGSTESNAQSQRTKRFIKHPGDGNPILIKFEIKAKGKDGTHQSIHTLKLSPKLDSAVITYNPLLDIT